jgi:hypothetical protein
MAKLKIKDIAMVALGATGGAYIADFIDDKITDMIDDPKMELGAKLALTAAGAYLATTQKGIMRDAAVSAVGQFGQGAIESAKAMMETSDKPTKGINDEIGAIFDEINEAMMNGNEAIVTGNEATVTGNEATVTGASYPDEND